MNHSNANANIDIKITKILTKLFNFYSQSNSIMEKRKLLIIRLIKYLLSQNPKLAYFRVRKSR